MAGKYHCVTIEFNEDQCCSLVRSYEGQRLLSDEAPHLPVQGCTRGDRCNCIYKHWPDRRQEPRRSSDYGLAGMPYYGPERRRTSERRERRARIPA